MNPPEDRSACGVWHKTHAHFTPFFFLGVAVTVTGGGIFSSSESSDSSRAFPLVVALGCLPDLRVGTFFTGLGGGVGVLKVKISAETKSDYSQTYFSPLSASEMFSSCSVAASASLIE